MRVLLDTHVLLWAPRRAAPPGRGDPSHDRKRRRRDAVQRRQYLGDRHQKQPSVARVLPSIRRRSPERHSKPGLSSWRSTGMPPL
jgi:hypothetical protein